MRGRRWAAGLLAALWLASGARAGEVCLQAPFAGGGAGAVELAALVTQARALIAGFPSLVEALEMPGLTICLADRLHSEHGYFEDETRRVVLSGALGQERALAVLLHELRHVDQARVGACPDPGLSMHENARAVFAMEADANAIALLVAWKAREEGDGALWAALAGWDRTADIAAAFAEGMEEGGTPARAASRAFAAWYGSQDRQEAYFLSSCMAYLDRSDRQHALPSYDEVAPEYFEALCRMPDGAAYPCAEPEGARP